MTVFVMVILLLGWILGEITGYGYFGLVIAIFVSIIMSFTSYFAGDKVALASTGAKEIKKEDNPYVYRMVENLCITAGMPLPKVYIIDDPSMNAFATGRDPNHAAVCVTSGIMRTLSTDELKGVLAHELAHVKNRDTLIMTIAAAVAGAIMMLAYMARWAALFGGYGRGSRDRRG